MPMKTNPGDITFSDWIEFIENTLGSTEWVTVFSRNEILGVDQGAIFSALAHETYIEKALDHYTWDCRIDQSYPFNHRGSNKDIEPLDIEPFIFWRTFSRIKEDYYEISEEFRHYFNLFEEDGKTKKDKRFINIDDNGDEIEVVRMSEYEVQVKLKYIKKYLSFKQMRLAIYFNFVRFSEQNLNDLGLIEKDVKKKDHNLIYSLILRNSLIEDKQSHAELMGKKIVSGLPNYISEHHDVIQESKYECFIIGIDENGDEILYTCDSNKLADYFGKNQGSPNFLTPVYFRKDVLKKYYDNPHKFSVGDGIIFCTNIWSLKIDNNHPEYVMVFLGYLSNLTYKEQLHWRHHNVPYQGKISRVCFQRNLMGIPVYPESPDLLFKLIYSQFQEEWFKKFGWNLFKPLHPEDEYLFKTLHIPTTNNEKEFDEQVLAITKVLIDSLNDKSLAKGFEFPENTRSITKLETFSESKGVEIPRVIEFFRNLQSLRSASVAHRKSDDNKEYQRAKEYFNIGQDEYPQVFQEILLQSIQSMESLEKLITT